MTVDGNPGGNSPRFTIGGVISIGVAALIGNLFRFLAITILVFLPATLLLVLGLVTGLAGAADATGMNLSVTDPSAAEVGFFVLFALLFLGGYFLMQAALTVGALQHLRGQNPKIGDCISHGLRALPRVFLATLLLLIVLGLFGMVAMLIFGSLLAGLGAGGVALGLALGAALLYVFTLLWVFVPAIVVEGAGVLECYGRSAELTKGYRGSIFAILVLIAAANWVIAFANQMLSQVAPVAGSVIDIASGLFFLALSPVLAAVGYYHLRAGKEGWAVDDVARVFD